MITMVMIHDNDRIINGPALALGPYSINLRRCFSCTYLDEKRSTMQNLNAKLLAHSIAWDGGEICLL